MADGNNRLYSIFHAVAQSGIFNMEIIRLFSEASGVTTLETTSVPMTPEDELGEHLTAIFPAIEVVLCEASGHFEQSWHTAPRRQLVVVLSGCMEIELHNGSRSQIFPGQVLLAEDTGGDGHQTRSIGEAPLQTMIIPLA